MKDIHDILLKYSKHMNDDAYVLFGFTTLPNKSGSA